MYKGDIIEVSNACVILHNTLVRMNQRGEFAADESEEGIMFGIFEEMYNLEYQTAVISQLER